MSLHDLTQDLRASIQETTAAARPLVDLTETLRLMMDDAVPVGTKHKWADGRTWVKQSDGSWAPEPSKGLPRLAPGRQVLALPAGTPQKPKTGTQPAVAKKPSGAGASVTKATADFLPDDPYKYFQKTPDAKLIPVSALRTIRARPEGIKNAAKYMAMAFNGEGEKRKPVDLKDNGDGTYTVTDGNSTTAMARAHNWKHIVAKVAPPDSKGAEKGEPSDSDVAATVEHDGQKFADFVKSGKLAPGVSPEEHVKIAKDFLGKHAKNLDKAMAGLKEVMPEGCKVKGRTKEVKSALGKLMRKPKYQRVDKLQDGTGMRVIAPDTETLNAAIDALKKKYKFAKNKKGEPEMDDYVSSPQGGAEGLGYRSFHAIIIDDDGLEKEVQLRTPNQDKHADWCHDIYKPQTKKQEEGMSKHADVIAKYARDIGDHLYAVDSKKKSEPPPCPEPVQQYFSCL